MIKLLETSEIQIKNKYSSQRFGQNAKTKTGGLHKNETSHLLPLRVQKGLKRDKNKRSNTHITLPTSVCLKKI